MRLKDLLEGFVSFPSSSLAMAEDVIITGLVLDSREVMEGDVFIALTGARQHGLTHIEQALNRGAGAVVFDPSGDGRRLAEQIINVPIMPQSSNN